MTPEGVKTAASDRDVSRRYVQDHLAIGIDALRDLRDSGACIKHMRFEELP
jgi:AMP nucleosidase